MIDKCSVTHAITKCPKDMEMVLKSCAIQAMFELRMGCVGMGLSQVSCVVFPPSKKRVLSNKAFKTGELVLRCFSTSLARHTGERKSDSDYILVSHPSGDMTFLVRGPAVPTEVETMNKFIIVPFSRCRAS